jgi:dimethylaniline monooxygenase (N-oxide forming)
MKFEGPSGLTAAKSMIEQGIHPVVFEKNDKIGGVWRSGVGNTWSSMQTNITKYWVCFSDYPVINASNSIFPYAHEMCQYLENYARHFKVTPHVRVDSKVIFVTQLDDERWLVRWKNTKTGKSDEQVFDFVVLSSGMYTTPNLPQYDGDSEFTGKIVHSKDYYLLKKENPIGTIMTVGISYSGCEISSDLAASNATVINVFKRPFWIFPKFLPIDLPNSSARLPTDFIMLTRQNTYSTPKFTTIEEENAYRNKYCATICTEQKSLPQTALHIAPDSTDPPNEALSNNYLNFVKNNRIIPTRGEIKCFNKDSVQLVDGRNFKCDAVVFCTGYSLQLDFIDKKILEKLEYDPNDRLQPLILHRATFRPGLKNIAFVGMFKEPVFIVDELQSRWASLVFSEKLNLPDVDIMEKNLEEARKKRFLKVKPQALDADYTLFTDELAKEINALPDFERIKEEDPDLYKMMWEGLPVPAHYRYNDDKELAIRATKEAYRVRTDFLKTQ